MSNTDGEARFEERQMFRQWWLIVLLAIPAAFVWYGFIQQIVRGIPWGSKPAPDGIVWFLVLSVGLILPALILSMGVLTRITHDQVLVRFKPIAKRAFDIAALQAASSITYRPIREYGGWGIRFSRKRGTAYSCSGNRGVRLTLEDGSRFLIGSQDPDALLAAIQKGRQALGLEVLPDESGLG